MCGIVGIISDQPIDPGNIASLQAATSKLKKRGPDAEGIENYGNAAFGHRRLSIIDTSVSSNQPLRDSSGRYSIVFNGEIYNYKELKEDLIKDGMSFQTESDTEVLLNCYIRYGTAFLNKLNGFFALAIYDKEEKSTLLARDRFGIKPLLYSNTKENLYFASEMKAMVSFDISKELDHSSIYTYLQLNYIP